MIRTQRKRHEECVLFLEDGFGESHAARLRRAGFKVETFLDHFRDPHTHLKKDSVKDPTIFMRCDDEGWLLVTTDHEMVSTHLEEIKKCSELAILATAHNRAADFNIWIDAIIKAKSEILRYYKKQERPCFAKIDSAGRITKRRTIIEADTTRRNRPREQEPAAG